MGQGVVKSAIGRSDSGDVIALAADHAGWRLKTALADWLTAEGRRILDLGVDGPASVDYPDIADCMADALASGRASRGILVCGTGIGIGMAANRHRAIRCAPVGSVTEARLARQHNDANVLALGERLIGEEVARDCVEVFLRTAASALPRHRQRVAKLTPEVAGPESALASATTARRKAANA